MWTDDERRVDRRRFLQTGAVAAAALASGVAAAAPAGPVVAVVRDKTQKSIAGSAVDGDIVRGLVDKAVMALAGKDDIAAAWGAYVRPKDRVAVKFNGLFRGASPLEDDPRRFGRDLQDVVLFPGFGRGDKYGSSELPADPWPDVKRVPVRFRERRFRDDGKIDRLGFHLGNIGRAADLELGGDPILAFEDGVVKASIELEHNVRGIISHLGLEGDRS